MALEDAKTQVDHGFTREDLRGLSNENTFGGATSFLRRRYTKDLRGVDIAITGVPFDQAVTNRPGTRLGPRAIREASSLQAPDAPYGWGYDPLSELAVADYGDLAFDYAMVADFPDALTAHIRGILEAGAASICLGGDHYISFPILKAYAEKYGPLSLIQFDAHTDTWADDTMERIDHGTMFYKAIKLGLIDPAR
jgi:agmatinase